MDSLEEIQKKEVQDNGNFLKYIKIAIVVFIFLLVAEGIYLYIGISKKTASVSSEDKNASFKPGFNDFIKSCLEKNELDSSCAVAFEDPQISDICNSFNGNLKDKCFYSAGIIKRDISYCREITITFKRNECLFYSNNIDSEEEADEK